MKIFHSHENSTFIVFIFILSLIITFPFLFLAIDTITLTTPLTINQTLVSNGQVFELGFFNLGNDNLFIGIWYKQIFPKTYVWVANRDTPITSLTGVLTVLEKGNILLLDQAESLVSAWSSNVSFPNRDTNTVAQLLDSGNFVLRWENDENPENYIWQSFDHPTDTLLPEMKLGWDRKTGLNRFLRSWRSNMDPSSGDYCFKMNIDGLPEDFISNKEAKIWRSGPWNGKGFSGVPQMKGEKIMDFKFRDNSDEIYYSFEMLNTSVYSRLIINSSGIIQRFIWVETTKAWSVYWFLPQDICDYFGECGAFGVCSSSTAPRCNCMPGFRPKNQQSWDRRDGREGCVRRSLLDCWSDGFLLMKNMKLPEGSKAFVDRTMDLNQCREICKRNCSCAAYASMDIDQVGSGCVIWEVDLMDMRQYTDSEGGPDLYVKVAASDLDKTLTNKSSKNSSDNNKHVAKVVSISVGVFGVLVILLVVTIFYLKKREKTLWVKKSKIDRTGLKEEKGDDFLLKDEVNELSKKEYYGETSTMNELDLPLFDFTTLDMATNNFSEANKLGQGGFGCVYKGTLTDGEVVAVKRLSRISDQGIEELKNEVQLIAKLQHRNLVRLLGCCIEVEEKLLVYEFMKNKSLDKFIFDKEESKRLNWQMRFDIICGIARGLLYLHQDSRFKIIHRDMKASNILLDTEMNPKISDFGMARIFGRDQTEAETKKVVGTYGYMSPEYAMDGNFSTKSDVFSFGVLVLEIMSGKKNRGSSYTNTQLNLLGHAWTLWKENNVLKLLDESIGYKYSKDEVLRCIQIGLLCVQDQAEDRPSMSKVLLMLSSETIQLPPPKYPGFFVGKRHFEIESSSIEYDSMTINEVTVTDLKGR